MLVIVLLGESVRCRIQGIFQNLTYAKIIRLAFLFQRY
jgi:hypothetical protein